MNLASIQAVVDGTRPWTVLTCRWQSVLIAEPIFRGDWHCDRPFGPVELVADHVITDPPYSERVHSKSRAGARKAPLLDGNGRMSRAAISREADFGFEHITHEERVDVAEWIEGHCRRWALVFSDVESDHRWRESFARFEYVRTAFWHKIGGTPQFTGDRPGTHLEAITCMHPRGRKAWNGGGKGNLYPALTVIERGGQRRANNERVHTTQKPLDLMLSLVEDFTSPGDLVVDLYAGSCTTGVACLRLGRRFVGFEVNSSWAELGRQRLRAEQQSTTPKAIRAGQESLFRKVG